ncbi:2-oxoglutarate and iron-dependent oxygenase domain-containing protein 3 [Leptinotarsa decemlineata]|uniref:2-oxoglutarate and iron-dependent oxygenase domain-containing protein 3 n=1 Tax=Leptinotarsa decemlineata TaxID=7539 RepID=UPI003D308F0D
MTQSTVSRKNAQKNKIKERKSDDEKTETSPAKNNTDIKYGPLPKFSGQRVWSRGIVVIGIIIYLWYFSKSPKESVLAKQSESYNRRGQNVDCGSEYLEDIKQYQGCIPNKCGRYVSDKIVTSHEADLLLRLANKGMALGGSSGGATILDLHSGALSLEDKFVNFYEQNKDSKILTASDMAVYQFVRAKIQSAIADSFAIDSNSIHLTYPTFFSRLSNADPKSRNDEYWHEHIDKRTYESFHYTSLLYLNDYGRDFKGGRFVFTDDISKPTKNTTVEPRKGRVLMFTSGSENPHFVERVSEGLRYAITVSFTCDISKAIQDPKLT